MINNYIININLYLINLEFVRKKSDRDELYYLTNLFIDKSNHILLSKIYHLDNLYNENVNIFTNPAYKDILNNLIDFDFYIVSKCKMLFSNDIQKIINSFKIHRFFNDYHWKNIQCFFDQSMSYQHISSNEIIFKPKYFYGIM